MHLFIITGLPNPNALAMQGMLTEKFKFGTFISAPASIGGDIYTEGYIRQMCKTIAEHLSSYGQGRCADRPKTLSIIFQPCETSHRIQESCFLFSRMLECDFEDRFNNGRVLTKIEEIITKAKNIPSYPDYFFLPAMNYYVERGKVASAIYHKIFIENINQNFEGLFRKQRFNKSNCQILHGKKKAHFFVDARDLIFPPCSPPQCHGNPNATLTDQEYTTYLAGYYRFGILKECTFHYDVQYANRPLGATSFDCPCRGGVKAKNASHANIYLNDFVRMG